MGFKENEARSAVDGARPQLTAEMTIEQAHATTLRGMPLPGRISMVRESFAEYVRTVPAA